MSNSDICLEHNKNEDVSANNDSNSYCDISEFTRCDAFSESSSNCSAEETLNKNNTCINSSDQQQIEKVEPLVTEEIRWFYTTKKNRLKAMVGCDSIKLENAWRLYHYEHSPADNVKRVLIRGGMYEADIISKQCYPVYWSNDDGCCSAAKTEGDQLIRGSWFFECNWHPLDENLADRIEKEHLERWKGIDLKEIKTSKMHDGVMHSVQLDGCHVDWNSVNDVLFYKDATTHRAFRNIAQKFGVSKVTSSGYRLHRGYSSLAVRFDNHLPVSHLVFLVHGIGAKSDNCPACHPASWVNVKTPPGSGRQRWRLIRRPKFLFLPSGRGKLTMAECIVHLCSNVCVIGLDSHSHQILTKKIVRNTADFRSVCRRVKPKNFTERVEFVPVEWRSKVSLDGDMVESITPKKSQTIRSFVNNTAMDVLYYASPLHRKDIVSGLRDELNRVHKLFMERNSTFDGKICILAHSLGSVILHDILTGWQPEYETEHADLQTRSQARCNELNFRADYLFCVGSPLGLFLCLRGYQLPHNQPDHRDDIIPSSTCRRLLNVFHPADPVAYRLEPLILARYKNVSPIQISSYHSIVKAHGTRAYSPNRALHNSPSKDESSPATDDEVTVERSSSPVDPFDVTETDESLQRSYLRSMSMAVAGGAAKLGRGLWQRAKRNNTEVDLDETVSDPLPGKETESDKEDFAPLTKELPPELTERIDYELPEGFTESKLGYASLTSHTSYWNNQDLAMFVMSQLLSEEAHSSSEQSMSC